MLLSMVGFSTTGAHLDCRLNYFESGDLVDPFSGNLSDELRADLARECADADGPYRS